MIKALVVDDSAFTRNMIRNILAENGVKDIVEAVDGRDAVDKYNIERPDIVFLDIMMPNEDGIKALEMIKQYDQNAKIVMCTSIDNEKLLNKAVEMGAMGYIKKPFKTDDIKEFVDKL